jgi:ribosomal protein S18 acetylase RimI-like enzyme
MDRQGAFTVEVASMSRVDDILDFEAGMTQSYGESWSWMPRETLKLNLLWRRKNPDSQFLLVIKDDQVIGCLDSQTFKLNPERQFIFISKLGVLPEYKRHHLGSLLLNLSIANAKDIGIKMIELIPRKDNHEAIAWYERRGFQVVGKQKANPIYRLTLQ